MPQTVFLSSAMPSGTPARDAHLRRRFPGRQRQPGHGQDGFSGGLLPAGTDAQYTAGVTISLTPLATSVYGLYSVSVTAAAAHAGGQFSIQQLPETIGSSGNQIALVGNGRHSASRSPVP